MAATNVYFFSNSNTAVTDGNGQISELQKSWLLLFVQFLKDRGEDPLNIEFKLPHGRTAKLFETESGYNWEIIDR